MGARDATAKFADHWAQTRAAGAPDTAARADWEGLLTDLETTFADRSTALLANDRTDLDKKTSYILRDQLAIMDIIASNLWERPIYWAVTCQRDRLMGMEDFLQLEGLSLRVVPVRTKSSLQNYGIIGSGRVNTDIAYDNIMNKWAWGNFDKERQFVDRSFLPSLQTMRISMIRIARQMVVENKKEQAVAFADKYFEA